MSRRAKIIRLCSFSSEDPNHPASNLLNPDTFRKWKCKEPGELEAFVILQMDKLEKILSIDIGNEASAFIEVAVARSGGSTQEFHTILCSSSFVNVKESKDETNFNQVKMFSSQLVKSVAAEKWDLIKVTCKQPFNPRIQYGISFIRVHVEPDPSDKLKMGGFQIRSNPSVDDDEFDDPIRIGSFFAKKLEAGGFITKSSADKPLLSRLNPPATQSPASTTRTISATVEDRLKKSREPQATTSDEPMVKKSRERKASTSDEPLVKKSRERRASTSDEPFVKKSRDPKATRSDESLVRKSKEPKAGSSIPTKLNSSVSTSPSTSFSSSSSSAASPVPVQKKIVNQISSSDVSTPKSLPKKSKQSPTIVRRSPDVIVVPNNSIVPIKRPGSSDTGQKSFLSLLPKIPKISSIIKNKPSRSISAKKDALVQKRKKIQKKPFDKLLEGVVFVMSGYENPYRSQLRKKAEEMGAVCKHDWDASCTHLICAFVTTPKFRQVKSSSGNAKVVTKNWIEDSYAKKCRFPWRRYCLDKNDKGGESEEEIFALEDDDGESTDSEDIFIIEDAAQHEAITVDLCDEDEDSAFISSTSTTNSTKRRRRISSSSSDDDDPAYHVDTDVDEDEVHTSSSLDLLTNDSSIISKSNHEKYNDFFNSKLFFLHPHIPLHQDQRNDIEQIIQQHKGSLASNLTSEVDYIVADELKWSEDFSEVLCENPRIIVIGEMWIRKCDEANKMINMDAFMILPD